MGPRSNSSMTISLSSASDMPPSNLAALPPDPLSATQPTTHSRRTHDTRHAYTLEIGRPHAQQELVAHERAVPRFALLHFCLFVFVFFTLFATAATHIRRAPY